MALASWQLSHPTLPTPPSALHHIASCTALPNAGNTPLHIAALNGQSVAIRALREFGCEVDVKGTEAASTPLIGAASWGYGEAVGALLAAGASPNAMDRDGNTALHYIVMCWQVGWGGLFGHAGRWGGVAGHATC